MGWRPSLGLTFYFYLTICIGDETGVTREWITAAGSGDSARRLDRPAERQEATARSANRRLPVNFKALIRRLTIGGHARQQ
jgi:hypothetical protein